MRVGARARVRTVEGGGGDKYSERVDEYVNKNEEN